MPIDLSGHLHYKSQNYLIISHAPNIEINNNQLIILEDRIRKSRNKTRFVSCYESLVMN